MKTLFAAATALLVFVSVAQASTITLAPVERGMEYIYPEPNGYQLASVTVEYEALNDNFRARLTGTGLKPNFTYQVKLEAIPACAGGNDETNEKIGYSGRWTCLDCESSPAGNNRTDAQYEANKLLPDDDPNKECIAGYLVFDYIVADSNGNADAWLETDASYHVLWCGPVPGSNAYLESGYTPPGSYCQDGKYCTFEHIAPEIERPRFSRLPEGLYRDLRFVLTEESFHQNCGTWCSVLAGEVLFEIDHEYDADADGCINVIDPNPDTPSPDSDSDGYGADCDCDEGNETVNPGSFEGSNYGKTCSDGLDNDCDGSADMQDKACEASSFWTETGTAEASVFRGATTPSHIANRLAVLLLPLGAILVLRILSRRKGR
jgi:hypothetical protein